MKTAGDRFDPRLRIVHYRLAAVVVALMAQGCASAYLRLAIAERPGVVLVGDERLAYPREPYPYFYGTGFDAFAVAVPVRSAVRGDADAFDLAGSLLLAPPTLVDLPFSGLLDAVLLPVDYAAHRRHAKAVAALRIRERELLRRTREH